MGTMTTAVSVGKDGQENGVRQESTAVPSHVRTEVPVTLKQRGVTVWQDSPGPTVRWS